MVCFYSVLVPSALSLNVAIVSGPSVAVVQRPLAVFAAAASLFPHSAQLGRFHLPSSEQAGSFWGPT